jgi:hypothetical protein
VSTAATVVERSNALAMRLANRRPAAQFSGISVLSPPGMWLAYGAAYLSAEDAGREGIGSVAAALGYTSRPAHPDVLRDAKALRATAPGDFAMRLWTRDAAGISTQSRSELARLGISVVSGPLDAALVAKVEAWTAEDSGGAIKEIGPELSVTATGLVLVTVRHTIDFAKPFRRDSVVSPPSVSTVEGGRRSLPGDDLAFYADGTTLTGVRLQSDRGTFFLFTGSRQDVARTLDSLTIGGWGEMKSRFRARVGRIVDGFISQSAYDFGSAVPLPKARLWGSTPEAAVQRGFVDFDTTRITLAATTVYASSRCCVDYVVNPQIESEFQWSSLRPLFFIEETPPGLIMFLGYRL